MPDMLAPPDRDSKGLAVRWRTASVTLLRAARISSSGCCEEIGRDGDAAGFRRAATNSGALSATVTARAGSGVRPATAWAMAAPARRRSAASRLAASRRCRGISSAETRGGTAH